MNGLLKVRSLRIGCPMYFRLSAALFYNRYRTSRTSAGQQSTKAKKSRSNMESGLFFPVTGWYQMYAFAAPSNSDCLESMSGPSGLWDCSHLDFTCQLQVQLVTCASDVPATNGRFPRPPLQFNPLLVQLRALRKTLMFTGLLYNKE